MIINKIKIIVKLNYNNEYNVIFDKDLTTETNENCLKYIKNNIIEIISLLLINNYINFTDLSTFSFEISSKNLIKPKVIKFKDKKLFSCLSIDKFSGDENVNYFWSIPFDRKINKKMIETFEGRSGNSEFSIKDVMTNYGYDFNTMRYSITSTK